MLDVRRMRVLREVAARGSFSAAADALAYTQSAVSQQIAALEREAGTRLVERSARGVRLTDAGRALVDHADVDPRAPGRRRGRARGDRRPARRAPAAGRLPERRRDDHARGDRPLPRAPPGGRAHARARRARALARSRCAPARSTSRSTSPRASARRATTASSATHLIDDPMYVALPAGHPLARKRDLKLEELADESWILGTTGSCPDASIFLRSCQLAGFEPERRLQQRRLLRDPGLRRRRHGRLADPGPGAHHRARRHRRAVARRPRRPRASSGRRRCATASARRPSRRCSTSSPRSGPSSRTTAGPLALAS